MRWFLMTIAGLLALYGLTRFGPEALRLPAIYAMLIGPPALAAVRTWRDGRRALRPGVLAAAMLGAALAGFVLSRILGRH